MVPNFDIFFLSRDFANRQIPGCWFQIWQYYFQIPAQKAILVPNLINAPNFAVRQIWWCWFQVFQHCCPKHWNKAFLSSGFKDSHFCTKHCFYKNSRMLMLNIRILFSNPSPKFRYFLFFQKILLWDKFERADFK